MPPNKLPQISPARPKKDAYLLGSQRSYPRSKAASDCMPDEYLDAMGVGFSQLSREMPAQRTPASRVGRVTTLADVMGAPAEGSPRAAGPGSAPPPSPPGPGAGKPASPPALRESLHLVPFAEAQQRRVATYETFYQRMAADMDAAERHNQQHEARLAQSSYNRLLKPVEEKRMAMLRLWLPIVYVTECLKRFRACYDTGRAVDVFRRVVWPIWKARQNLRRRLRERAAMCQKRVAAMRPPEPRVLKSNSIFSQWDERYLKAVIALMKPAFFQKGQAIILQGIKGKALYLLDNGSAGAYVSPRRGKGYTEDTLVFTMNRSMLFGEIGLICDEPHEMTIRCHEDSDCWVLSRTDFLSVVAQMGNSSAAQQVIDAQSKQYRVASLVKNGALQVPQLQALPLFKFWPQARLQRLVPEFQPMVTNAGDTVVTQGDKGTALYYVSNGQLSVQLMRSSGTTQEVAVLSTGDVFGEVPCLFLETMNMTVQCKTPCALWMLPKKNFINELLGNALLLLQAKEIANQRRAEWISKLPVKYLSAMLKRAYPQHAKKLLQPLHEALLPRVFGDGDAICIRQQACSQVLFISEGKAKSDSSSSMLGPGVCLGWDTMGSLWKETVRAVGKVEVWFLFDTQLQKETERFLNPEAE